MSKLIYIGGYGHSGSTLLEYLMTGSPSVLACGEVSSAVRQRGTEKRKRCSCGRPGNRCPVWSFFYTSERGAAFTHVKLLRTLMENFGGEYAAIVDSSKTAWGSIGMPFRLKRQFGDDVLLVHLIRQPTAVAWSVVKKRIRKLRQEGRRERGNMLRCCLSVVAWSIANLSCELFGSLYPRQYVRIRYEDLVRAPAETVSALFEKILPDPQWNFQQRSGNRHQLYGNRLRYERIEITDVNEDLRWKSEMPDKYSRMVLSLTLLSRHRYGYIG